MADDLPGVSAYRVTYLLTVRYWPKVASRQESTRLSGNDPLRTQTYSAVAQAGVGAIRGTAMIRILISGLAFALAGCSPTDEPLDDIASCLDDLAAHRSSIDSAFANHEYPLSDEQKADFDGLLYYPPKAEYCIPASFEEVKASETFEMPTYNEKSIPFREFGVFEFHVDEVAYSLSAYQRMDLPEEKRQWVLVPFKDNTNSRGTYGGGRYLEIQFPINAQTEIDFNRAANPWCAYDAKYTCPVPPVQNWLDLSIEAGEKMFVTAHSGSH